MDTPEVVTVGVVLFAPESLDVADLERESAHAARVAARLGVAPELAYGQAIARIVPSAQWDALLDAQGLARDTPLLASVYFFDGRRPPELVAGALAAFAHAWLHRREHGTEPPGSLPLTDMPPGPLSGARSLREAALLVNPSLLDDARYGAWIRAFQSAWDDEPAPN